MKLAISLHEITRRDRSRVGGKGFALARMQSLGLHVPEALCISTDACKPEVRQLLERILDQFGDLAWENGRLGQDRGLHHRGRSSGNRHHRRGVSLTRKELSGRLRSLMRFVSLPSHRL